MHGVAVRDIFALYNVPTDNQNQSHCGSRTLGYFRFSLKASRGTSIIECESQKSCGLRDGRGERT